MRRTTAIAATSALVLLAALAFPPGAEAVGELTSGGCVDDNDSGFDLCGRSVNGLNFTTSVAVSPDGTSVYAVSAIDNALVRFNRSSTGALTPAGCIDDNDTGPDVCALSVNGLRTATTVAVSPDGRSVYVASPEEDAIVRFNRDAAGALTPAGCIDDNDDGPDGCASSVNGLDGALSVTVSPDGASVYVLAPADDAVVRFNRSATGALTSAGCVDDNDTGADACAQSVNGLDRPTDLAVSADGVSVYVASALDDAVVHFNRDATGALTPAGCIDDNDDGPDVCARSINGLDNADSVAVSPDGTSAYVTAAGDNAIVRFTRSTTGALTSDGCIDDNDDSPDVCDLSVNGMEGAASVAVSPDGRSVYASGFEDDAVVRFTRAATGALTSGGCIDDNDTGADVCALAVNGLNGATSLTVSPDGASVYVAADQDDAIVRFNRAG